MSKAFFFLLICVFYLLGSYTEDVYYRSKELLHLKTKRIEGAYSIWDDNHERVDITALEDGQGILYWYRRIKTPVCLTGECKLIDIGIYWDCTGRFLGLEIYGEHLTKTDHSDFSQEDYDQLMGILHNDWSLLREYELSELVDDPYEEVVDGASGATKKEIASEAVKDAVYTTHTIWHLIHQGEKEQLATLTLEELKNNTALTSNLLKNGKKEYRYFLLDLVGLGKLPPSPLTDTLVITGLKAETDDYLKKLSANALVRSNVDQPSMQSELAVIYRKASLDEKLLILPALTNLTTLAPDLYEALGNDLGGENEWYKMKILQVLLHSPDHSEKVIVAARALLKSENTLVRQTATDFLKQAQ